MPTLTKAAVIKQWGSAEAFEIEQLTIPSLGSDDVLIKVAFAGLNPADWKVREGHLSSQMPYAEFPMALGLDGSGTVLSVGSSVEELQPGDRVSCGTNLFSEGRQGAYSEYLVVNKSHVAKIPQTMSFESAATLPIAGITAWQALFSPEKGALSEAKNKKVFINGASGGVGSFAVQLAKWQGAEVATTCSSFNLDYVTSLGSDVAIDYKTQNVAQEIQKWAPEGVDLIIDAVGGESLSDPIGLLKQGGTLVSIATITDDGDILKSIEQAQQRGCNKVFAYLDDQHFSADLARIIALVEQNELVTPPTRTYSLSDITLAHKKLESGRMQGKLVLQI